MDIFGVACGEVGGASNDSGRNVHPFICPSVRLSDSLSRTRVVSKQRTYASGLYRIMKPSETNSRRTIVLVT